MRPDSRSIIKCSIFPRSSFCKFTTLSPVRVSAASTVGVLFIVAVMVSPLFLRIHICEFRILRRQVYDLERSIVWSELNAWPGQAEPPAVPIAESRDERG